MRTFEERLKDDSSLNGSAPSCVVEDHRNTNLGERDSRAFMNVCVVDGIFLVSSHRMSMGHTLSHIKYYQYCFVL